MFIDADKMPPYERQLILVANQVIQRSPDIDVQQKTRIEAKFQEIIKIFVEKTGEGR